MPKVGIQPVRRRQLIDATVATIHAYGYDDATIARISARAGISSGLISHYFGGKNELLAATMRSLLSDLHKETVQRLAKAQTPQERVAAIVNANFAETQCTPPVVTAWLAFWAQVPHAPVLARLQQVYVRRLRSNLRHALRPLGLNDAEMDEAAEILASLIDGIWVRSALADGGLDVTSARAKVMKTLRLYLGESLG